MSTENTPINIADSGERRVFESGAHRDRVEGKGAFHLLPFNSLQRVARIFEGGAKKYTVNNWRLGMPVSEYYNSGIRHAIKAANGWDDEDHPAQACWNFLCAMETQWMVEQGMLPPELNDVRNFMKPEEALKAFQEIRARNEARQKAKEAQKP